MSRLLRIVAVVLVGLMIPTSASARTKGGVTMPDTVQLGGKRLVLNGLGIREATFLNIDVYVAGLYIEQRSSDPNFILSSPGPKRLALQFVRDVDQSDIVDAWEEGLDKNAGEDKAAIEGADFARAFFLIWLGPHPPNEGLKDGLLGK